MLVLKAERRMMEELLKLLGFTTPLICAGRRIACFSGYAKAHQMKQRPRSREP